MRISKILRCTGIIISLLFSSQALSVIDRQFDLFTYDVGLRSAIVADYDNVKFNAVTSNHTGSFSELQYKRYRNNQTKKTSDFIDIFSQDGDINLSWEVSRVEASVDGIVFAMNIASQGYARDSQNKTTNTTYLSLNAESLREFILNAAPHVIGIRITAFDSSRTKTVFISQEVKHEWKLLLEMSFDDASLVNALPFGSPIFLVGKKITGWVIDPKASAIWDREVHIYRGEVGILSIVASTRLCTTASGNACAALANTASSWRQPIYEFDLNMINGPSTDPVQIVAINSIPGQPNMVVARQQLALRDDIECVYNWAERIYGPSMFPEHGTTVDEGVHRVRRYSNGSFLAAIFGDGTLSYLPNSSSRLVVIGNIKDFLSKAIEQNCGQ